MAKYSIGRSSDCDVTIDDKTVSRQHAELETRGDGSITLRDLGSSFGTSMQQGDDWVDVSDTATTVTAETAVRLGEHETSVGALTAIVTGNAADPDATFMPPAGKPKSASPQPVKPAPAAKPAARAVAPEAAGAGSGNTANKWVLMGGAGLLACVMLVAVLVFALGGDDRSSSMTASRSAAKQSDSGSLGKQGLGQDDQKKEGRQKDQQREQQRRDGGQRDSQRDGQRDSQRDRQQGRSDGDRGQVFTQRVFRRIVSQCVAAGRYNRAQCVCAGRTIVTGLSPDELAMLERLNTGRNRQETFRALITQFGQEKVQRMTRKLQFLSRKIMQDCGFNPNAR